MDVKMEYAQQGWQCPICKKVYAPWMAECTRCGNQVTSTTTSVGKSDDSEMIHVKPNLWGITYVNANGHVAFKGERE